eukprot:gene9974-20736_t
MVQLFLRGLGLTKSICVDDNLSVNEFRNVVSNSVGGLAEDSFYLSSGTKLLNGGSISDYVQNFNTITIGLRVLGGIDFQHREGSKIGSGGQLSEQQAAIERRERLRKLALETIDLAKDPYFMRNHLGSFECKLCLTLHNNEGNYLAHTQGKRHQSNLARRAAMEAKNAPAKPLAPKDVSQKSTIKIGRPGYKVTKSRDLQTRQKSLTFEVDYPEGEGGIQPRHRFMSAYEQKIPNYQVDKREGRFFTNWDSNAKKFILQLYFIENDQTDAKRAMTAAATATAPHRPQLRYN